MFNGEAESYIWYLQWNTSTNRPHEVTYSSQGVRRCIVLK